VPRARYDLENRLLGFAVDACRVVESLPANPIGRHVAGQLVRSATSPAANYAEAVAAESRRDFVHKLRVCLKELRETRMWLMFINRLGLSAGQSLERATTECDELIAILAASIRTTARTGRSNVDH
jgi:four helix bundle protein